MVWEKADLLLEPSEEYERRELFDFLESITKKKPVKTFMKGNRNFVDFRELFMECGNDSR